MDFSVANIRCYDTVKVHHDKRWLRQQRLLVVSTSQVLNCPFPAKNTPAARLFELFGPHHPAPSLAPSADEIAGSSATSPESPYGEFAAAAASASAPSKNGAAGGRSEGSKQMEEAARHLQERYEKVCTILGMPRVHFEDIKAALNPSKTHELEDITGVLLKGAEGICINFRNDHSYFYNTPYAIEVSHVLRTRFVAHSSAKLVEGNFGSPLSPSPSRSAGGGGDASAFSEASPMNAIGGGFEGAVAAAAAGSSRAGGFSRIADLFQAGVIQLPALSDVDHLQPAAMELTKALDWLASPAAALSDMVAHIRQLSDDAVSWRPKVGDLMASGSGGGGGGNVASSSSASGSAPSSTAALRAKELHDVMDNLDPSGKSDSNTSRAHSGAARSQPKPVVNGTPQKALDFRTRLTDLRSLLVRNFLLSTATAVVEPERSVGEKLAFWRSKRKIPTFEDADEAELVAELALQNLMFRSEPTFRNLWADVALAYHDEAERFRHNCRLLAAPAVPFAYFGIPADFESVRFDLVRFHLQSLSSCRSPSAMLNSIVSAIKCVIVCVKARHVLSRRWSRAMSGIAATSDSAFSSSSRPRDDEGDSDGGNIESLSTQTSPVSSPIMPTSANFWTREELDAIAEESKKHSVYNTDDVLPVFIYIVVFCDIPQLALFYRFLEVLGFDGESSERTFYATVFASAIEWLIQWKKPTRRELREKAVANPQGEEGEGAAAAVEDDKNADEVMDDEEWFSDRGSDVMSVGGSTSSAVFRGPFSSSFRSNSVMMEAK